MFGVENQLFLASHWPCAECGKEGKDGYIVERYLHRTTLGGWSPHVDDNGEYHEHDWNQKAVTYACNLGHSYRLEGYHPCRCGWMYVPSKPDKIIPGKDGGPDIAIYEGTTRLKYDIVAFEQIERGAFNVKGVGNDKER